MKTDYCEHPNHVEYIKTFMAKYPNASKHWGYREIINVDPEEWTKDLEHPEKNISKCCQVCTISEEIKRVSYRGISNYLLI